MTRTDITLGSLCLDVTALVCGDWAAHPSVDRGADPITGWALRHEPSGLYVSPHIVDGLDRDEAERILLAFAEAGADVQNVLVLIQIIYAELHDPVPPPPPAPTDRVVMALAIPIVVNGAMLLDAITAAAGDDGELAGLAAERLARWIGIAPSELETWAAERPREDVLAVLRGASS